MRGKKTTEHPIFLLGLFMWFARFQKFFVKIMLKILLQGSIDLNNLQLYAKFLQKQFHIKMLIIMAVQFVLVEKMMDESH